MNRTKIEWCDYTVNPVKGKCPVGCEYCYMWGKHGIGMRFHFDQRIRYDASAWLGVGSLRKPSRIFVGSTIELFHPRTEKYLKYIFMEVEQSLRETPQHTFIFLTKQPQNLIKFSPFPDNCYVGVTATGLQMFNKAMFNLQKVEASVKYISFEPLLEELQMCSSWLTLFGKPIIDWLIIGQQTLVSAKTEPKIEWIREIVEAADKAGIPVFLKDNLKPLIITEGYPYQVGVGPLIVSIGDSRTYKLRQEMPREVMALV